MQANALMTWQPHQLRFITLSQHLITGFFLLLFILAAKLTKAYTSTKQGLELLVKLRQQENRYEGRHRGVFENIYSAAHGENSNTKYKIEKLASEIKCIRKDDFKEGMNCGASRKFNQGYHGEKEATRRMWRNVWCSQPHKLGEGTATFYGREKALLRAREGTLQYSRWVMRISALKERL